MAGAQNANVTLDDIENAVERGIRRGISAVRNNSNEGKQLFFPKLIVLADFVSFHMMNIYDINININDIVQVTSLRLISI